MPRRTSVCKWHCISRRRATSPTPSAYGLLNATEPCLHFGVVVGAICAHPGQYVFCSELDADLARELAVEDVAEDVLLHALVEQILSYELERHPVGGEAPAERPVDLRE